MVEVGVGHLPVTADRALELAIVAERAGLDRFGIADSPVLYGATFPIVQHVVTKTDRIRVGPAVSNPVTRHWSVQAADLEELVRLSAGRVYLAMGSGDSSLHPLGLRPANGAQLAEAFDRIRGRVGPEVELISAASGPKAAGLTSAAVDGIMLAGGLDVDWLRTMGEIANGAAGRPLRRWLFIASKIVASAAEVQEAHLEVRGSVMGMARHGLGRDPKQRGAPPALSDRIVRLFESYDYTSHARIGGPNAGLLSSDPEVAVYLRERYSLVGTPETAAKRLAHVIRAAQLDGVMLTSTLQDPVRHIELIGHELLPRLRELLAPPERTVYA